MAQPFPRPTTDASGRQLLTTCVRQAVADAGGPVTFRRRYPASQQRLPIGNTSRRSLLGARRQQGVRGSRALLSFLVETYICRRKLLRSP